MKRLPRRLIALAVVACLLLLFWLLHRTLLTAAADWLDVGVPPQKADAVVLLNGGTNTRPFVAAALVRGGWSPSILISSILRDKSSDGQFPTTRKIDEKIFQHCGVPREAIVVLDGNAATTFDEAKAVAAYLDERHDQHVSHLLIVTERPHTRRARWVFRQVLGNRPVAFEMISSPMDEFRNDNWWRSELGVLFVVSEYFKLVYYALRYGWLGYELLLCLAAAMALRHWLKRKLAHE